MIKRKSKYISVQTVPQSLHRPRQSLEYSIQAILQSHLISIAMHNKTYL